MAEAGPTAEAGLAGLPGSATLRNGVSATETGEGEVSGAAAEALQLKREQLELEKMELELAERREQQAIRLQKIKERELELAERTAKINDGGIDGQSSSTNAAQANTTAPSQPATGASVERGKHTAPLQTSRETGLGSIAPEDGSEPGSQPAPSSSDPAAAAAPGTIDHLSEPSGELAKKVALMRLQAKQAKEDVESKLTDLERKTAAASEERERRVKAARTLAEQAVKEARTARVTDLANLVANAMSLVKKSSSLLDHLVLQLMEEVDMDPAAGDASSSKASTTAESKLVALLTNTDAPPTLEQLEEAAASLEALKPNKTAARVQALQGELAELQVRIDALTAGEAKVNASAHALDAAADVPLLTPMKQELNTAKVGEAEDMPPEAQERLASLREQKRYLEEIRNLEEQVRALQEGSNAGPPGVEEGSGV